MPRTSQFNLTLNKYVHSKDNDFSEHMKLHGDVIVIGSGATGTWAARLLTQNGFKVILIDGGFEPPERPRLDTMTLSKKEFPYGTSPGKPFDWIRVRALGGRMNVWSRTAIRMSNMDFTAPERDGFGEPWPFSYDDLVPFYEHAEEAFKIIGCNEGVSQIPDGKVIKIQPSSMHRYFKKKIEGHWKNRKVIVARDAIAGIHKQLFLAQKTGRLSVYDGLLAHKLLESANGKKVQEVVAIDVRSKKEVLLTGRAVVLCASTIESTRILLDSKTKRQPQGFANSSGVLGHYLMDHTIVDCEGLIPFDKGRKNLITQFSSSVIPDFCSGHRKDFLRGYLFLCDWHPCPQNSGGVCHYGSHHPPHAGHFFFRVKGEVLPYFSNCVSLNSRRKDINGVATVDIHFECKTNERRLIADKKKTAVEVAEAAGLVPLGKPVELVPGTSAHEVGTARMGKDPKKSVLNPYNQSWDFENLYVMDGSCFVSAGSQNPTLTMLALCHRACNHLSSQLKYKII